MPFGNPAGYQLGQYNPFKFANPASAPAPAAPPMGSPGGIPQPGAFALSPQMARWQSQQMNKLGNVQPGNPMAALLQNPQMAALMFMMQRGGMPGQRQGGGGLLGQGGQGGNRGGFGGGGYGGGGMGPGHGPAGGGMAGGAGRY